MTLGDKRLLTVVESLSFSVDYFGLVMIKEKDSDNWLLTIPVRESNRGIQILVKKADKVYIIIGYAFQSRDKQWVLNTSLPVTKLSFELTDTESDLIKSVKKDVEKRLGFKEE